MEMEQSAQVTAKKLWGIVRVVMYMLKKSLSKSKLWLDLHMMLKRSGKFAGKAIGNLPLHHQSLSSALTCRPNDITTTFIAPREYEFSCSNSPVFNPRRKNNRRHHHHTSNYNRHTSLYRGSHKDREVNVTNIKMIFDILNNYDQSSVSVETEKSPLALSGFGPSPHVRQLRVSDSPFPMINAEEDTFQVDKAADEFIKNFYSELKQQKKRAVVESPSPYHKWGLFR